VLVVHKARHARHLGARRRCGISSEFLREASLHVFRTICGKPAHPPEHMKSSWRRTEDVRNRRQFSPRIQFAQNARAVMIDVENDMPDRSDRILPSRTTGRDGVGTDVHAPPRRIPKPQPRLEARRCDSGHRKDPLRGFARLVLLDQHSDPVVFLVADRKKPRRSVRVDLNHLVPSLSSW
jgi:hypothetical protein